MKTTLSSLHKCLIFRGQLLAIRWLTLCTKWILILFGELLNLVCKYIRPVLYRSIISQLTQFDKATSYRCRIGFPAQGRLLYEQ